ncbi:MAG: sulfotransferase [Cyanobacteriota bacterium]|nr:sulfotransferase [Cyanobacteriota bacterium]
MGKLLDLAGKTVEAIEYYQEFSYRQNLATHPEITKQYWSSQQLRKPDFIICGSTKCGTTSLYNYLIAHPQVLPAVEKELYFFSHYFERELDWYFAHFPSIDNRQYLVGEASPTYLNWADPERLLQILPDVKLIFMLRNPVHRTISSFYQIDRISIEQPDLEDFIKWVTKTLSVKLESSKDIIPKPLCHLAFSEQLLWFHLIPSLYSVFIKKWLTVFHREQILALESEELYKNPSRIMNEVYRFLDLPECNLTNYQNFNPGSYALASSDVLQKSNTAFHLYNLNLQEYLGRQFNW